MRAALVLVSLLVPLQGLPAQQGAYEAALRSLRAEFSGMELYLANRPMSHLKNAPPDAPSDSLLHGAAWLAQLERDGVISASCVPEQYSLGCAPPDSLVGRPHVSASFWPLSLAGSDSVIVEVTLSLPPLHPEVANVEKREYAVSRTPDGRWTVVSCEVAGVS